MNLSEKIFSEFNTGDAMADSVINGKEFEYKEIPLELIEPHPNNRAINNEMVERIAKSIQEEGLGQAALVRELENGRYQMIAGEHRLEAFKLLLAWTAEERYKKIPCVLRKDCSDEKAERLLWATNLHSTGLSQEERGHAFEILGMEINKKREEDPEAFAGKRTNEIIAEIASDSEHSVSEATVKRARKAYKDSLKDEPEEQEEVDASAKREAVLDNLQKAINKVQVAVYAGVISPAVLVPYVKKLRGLSKAE